MGGSHRAVSDWAMHTLRAGTGLLPAQRRHLGCIKERSHTVNAKTNFSIRTTWEPYKAQDHI